MFSLLQNILGSQKLLVSDLYNERAFYWAFLRDLKAARRNVVIESPYLTEKKARYFMPALKELHQRKVSVRINTRNPNFHDSYMKDQAEKALAILKTSRAKIYVYTDLRHWKLAAIDKSILWGRQPEYPFPCQKQGDYAPNPVPLSLPTDAEIYQD